MLDTFSYRENHVNFYTTVYSGAVRLNKLWHATLEDG